MQDKQQVFQKIAAQVQSAGFTIVQRDENRPWGGFFVIDEAEAAKFASYYFPEENFSTANAGNKLSPKILMVAPHKRLSWQYHHRRAEIWRSVGGAVAVATSDTDEQSRLHTLQNGEVIKLKQGERHRLIGLDDWGIVAEIWMHTDNANPSDEDDIVRLQDDYGR
jgi:mannose-6-phosphate isomerase